MIHSGQIRCFRLIYTEYYKRCVKWGKKRSTTCLYPKYVINNRNKEFLAREKELQRRLQAAEQQIRRLQSSNGDAVATPPPTTTAATPPPFLPPGVRRTVRGNAPAGRGIGRGGRFAPHQRNN